MKMVNWIVSVSVLVGIFSLWLTLYLDSNSRDPEYQEISKLSEETDSIRLIKIVNQAIYSEINKQTFPLESSGGSRLFFSGFDVVIDSMTVTYVFEFNDFINSLYLDFKNDNEMHGCFFADNIGNFKFIQYSGKSRTKVLPEDIVFIRGMLQKLPRK